MSAPYSPGHGRILHAGGMTSSALGRLAGRTAADAHAETASVPRRMVVHSDEVEPRIIDGTQLRGTRWRLGAAAGAVRAGLSRYRIAPGERAMPVHVHADEEELFYVLAGEGLSWRDGRVYPV